MAVKNRATLKTYFEDGDIPSADNFADLIDSCVNVADDNTEADKRQLFNDTWDVLVGTYGRYDPGAAPDADHPYLLNGLWFTYKEAIEIVAYANTPIDDVPYAFIHSRVKTLIPPQTAGSGWSGA